MPPRTAQTLLTARQTIQPAEPNAAKPKPIIIPGIAKILITNIKALICRSVGRLLVGMETRLTSVIDLPICGLKSVSKQHLGLAQVEAD